MGYNAPGRLLRLAAWAFYGNATHRSRPRQNLARSPGDRPEKGPFLMHAFAENDVLAQDRSQMEWHIYMISDLPVLVAEYTLPSVPIANIHEGGLSTSPELPMREIVGAFASTVHSRILESL